MHLWLKYGLLKSTMQGIKDSDPKKIIEAVADKGYEAMEDMAGCLEKGIIPHVMTDDGKGEWKETGFTKDQLIKPCKDWINAEGKKPEEMKTNEKWHYEKKKRG